MHDYDVIVVGGGMVGLALCRALSETSAKIAVISLEPLERELSSQPEHRVSAINEINRTKLESLGVWQRIPVDRMCAYQTMKVWDEHSFGKIQFDAAEVSNPQLGTIVENQALVNSLAETVEEQSNIDVIIGQSITSLSQQDNVSVVEFEDHPSISAKLVIGADGGQSFIRKLANFNVRFGDYGQQAIVTTVRAERVHGNTAHQAFTPHGPLALLPLSDPNLCSVVWSQSSDVAQRLMDFDEGQFNKEITVASDQCLGQLQLETARKHFPLNRLYALQWLKDGVVLCGDAAHTIHPLAGQGVNLGFGDAWSLAEHISEQHQLGKSLFSAQYLRAYERSRKTAAANMLLSMETFHQLFTGDSKPKKLLRGLGLVAANKFTPLKTELMRQALGLSS